MKKDLKISLLEESKINTKIAHVFLKYDLNYYYYVNEVNEKFFLAQEENDFQLDGFHIRKISHITKVEIKNDMCLQINVWNGVVNQVRNPNIDISSWRSAFEGLKNYPGFLIIEDEINEQFAIGQIAEIKKSSLIFRPFDADGVWQEELLIPYSSITHVSWNTRYANQWYEYLNRD